MTILINAISAKQGGIVTYTTNLARSLAKRGISFRLAVPPSFPPSPGTFSVAANNYGPIKRVLWEQFVWRRMIEREKPRVLFSSANYGLLASPVPQVLLIREGGLFDRLYLSTVAPDQGIKIAMMRYLRRQLMLMTARQNDHIITPTHAMREMLLGWAPELETRCTVNTYGTLLDYFRPAERPRPWRADGMLRLLFVSVYYPHKNPRIVADVVKSLGESGLPATATITMSLDEIQRMNGGALDHLVLSQAAADGRIDMSPMPYGELPSVYHKHDVFVFPSISETFGHPLVEAMSCGLPIVAADTLVNREVCGDAALYFKPFSTADFVRCLRRLDAEPDLRRTLAEQSRLRSETKFGWPEHVDRLLDIFDRVSSGAGGTGR